MTLQVNEAIDLTLSIEREEVLHFLGYPPGHALSRRIEDLLETALEEARRLAHARGVFVELPVSRASEVELEAMEALGLVIGLVTAGDAIEKRATELLRAGEPTRALLLDAAGSAAAEEAADRMGALIAGETEAARAAHLSCRISPGYGRWAVSSQKALFGILPAEAVGVTLLPSMLMLPRKSVSFAMWLGADARPLSGLSGCAVCGLEECRYRRDRLPSPRPSTGQHDAVSPGRGAGGEGLQERDAISRGGRP